MLRGFKLLLGQQNLLFVMCLLLGQQRGLRLRGFGVGIGGQVERAVFFFQTALALGVGVQGLMGVLALLLLEG